MHPIVGMGPTKGENMSMKACKIVARAIADALPGAGQPDNVIKPLSAPKRAMVLIEQGYVREAVWASGSICEILMESRGNTGDCGQPLDYYAGGEEASSKVSDLLTAEKTGATYGWFIEFHNAAVAGVYLG